MVEEIQLLKNEVVQTKAAHAGLHQSAVEKNAEVSCRFDALNEQLTSMASSGTGGAPGKFKKPLIEPKQIEVAKFAGAVSDSRSKFLTWVETVMDRAGLFDENLVDAMNAVEASKEPVTQDRSAELRIPPDVSKELHGFL